MLGQTNSYLYSYHNMQVGTHFEIKCNFTEKTNHEYFMFVPAGTEQRNYLAWKTFHISETHWEAKVSIFVAACACIFAYMCQMYVWQTNETIYSTNLLLAASI